MKKVMCATAVSLFLSVFPNAPSAQAAAAATVAEFTVPTSGSQPWGIAAGPDGALWFTESSKIGRMTTAGVFTEYALPVAGTYPNAIVAGPDGNLWFADGDANKIGKITTSGTITEYAIPTSGSWPVGIVAGADGALWFTEGNGNKIGRITTTGTITEYAISGSNPGPWLIVAGPDGALWFTENTQIGRITTAGVITQYTVPTSGAYPWGIAAGPDGALWFTEEYGNRIGRITTAGTITEYPVTSSDLSGIVAGPDGALWFSDVGNNKIGQITTAGAVTEFAMPTSGAGLRLIALGPDSALYVAEQTTNKIGKVTVGGAACTYSLSASTASPLAAGGAASFTVTAGTGCTWTATSTVSWVTTSSTGSGNGTVNYTVAANTAASTRTGTITVGGQTFTITQAAAAACTYTLSAATAAPTAAGGAATITVTAGTGCAWTATSGVSWITTTSTGSGNGTVNYTVAANTGSASRTGAITVAGQTLTVTQAAATAGGPYVEIDISSYVNDDTRNYSGGPQYPTGENVFLSVPVRIPNTAAGQNAWAGTSTATGTTTVTVSVGVASVTSAYFILNSIWGVAGNTSDPTTSRASITFTGSGGATYTKALYGNIDIRDYNSGSYTNSINNTTTQNVWSADGVHRLDMVRVDLPAAFASQTLTSVTLTDNGANSTQRLLFKGLTVSTGSGGTTISNLLTNGDAEASTGGSDFSGAATIPGWTTDGQVAVVAYAANYDLAATDPGPTNRGKNYFGGGYDASSKMSQTVDLSSNATAIDAGTQAYTLDGWLGGWDGQDDNVVVTVTFQSSTGASLGTASIGPVLSADRNGTSSLIEKTATGTIPKNARKASVSVVFTRTSGSDNDSLMDNLVFGFGSGGSTVTCTYTLDALSRAAAAAQGNITVSVTTAAGCAWTAASTASWITVTAGASQSGTATATLQVAANSGGSRTGTVTIAGQTFTVVQAGPAQSGCSFNVSPTDIHATAAGMSNTMIIFTNTGCAWVTTVPSGVNWLTLNPTSGSGNGAVGYSIPVNSGPARNTTIVVAGTAVTVEQDAGSPCTYTLGATSQAMAGTGGAGAVTVTVSGSNCTAWTIGTPSVSWLHVTSTGSASTGAASYSVDPNTTTSQRTGTMSVAGQTYTVTEDVAPCTYSLSSATSPTIASAGGTGSLQITASSVVCPWAIALPTASTQQWIHITTASNASGSATVNYSVDPNTTTSARNLPFTVNGQKPPTQLTYTINQAAAAANTGPVPVVTPSGVVNSASLISANLPAGAIAQGSFFSIFGTNLGPDPFVQATTYPLGTTLAGVSIKITQGSTSVQAYPMFVAQFQINAVMPSNAPTGTVQVTVTYNGATSPAVSAQVVATSFGIFSISGGRGPGIVQNYVSPTQLPLNTSTTTAAPGDIVIVWGTGLGALPNGASDSQPPAGGPQPATVSISLGGQTVQPLYAGRSPGLAGVDQINFTVPQNVMQGCYVPLLITAGGVAGNTVTMAIATGRQACSDTNPLSAMPRTGGKNAVVTLARLSFTSGTNPTDSGSLDAGVAIFEQQASGGTLGFDLYSSMPPRNTCTAYSNMSALNSIVTGGLPSTGTPSIDAGSTITITGPNGARGFSYADPTKAVSPYFSLLGASGSISSSGLTSNPLFLDPGKYTISGNGGKDVGPFSFPMTVLTGATWTNRDQISTVDRSKDLPITWSGGDSTKQVGVVLGIASNSATNTSGGFACLFTLDKTSFTVPASMMANLPGTAGAGSGGVQGGLFFLTFPTGDQFVKFNTTSGGTLDSSMAMSVSGDLRSNITFK